jgi:hypothetical protein
MKFVKVKEVLSSHAVAGRWYRNSSEDLPPRLKALTFIRDFNASFIHKQTKLFQLLVEADVG